MTSFLDGLRPEPRYTVSQWADTHRYLSSEASAEPGQWRTSRVPYMREIMDNLSVMNPIQEVVLMKGAQVAATEAACNVVGYFISTSPCPILVVWPTDSTVKKNSKNRIAPMISATPVLREKIQPSRSRDSGNTLAQKDFAGGTLVMVGANSPVGLRSMPARVLVLDEVDAYPMDVSNEGNPVDLARKRTATFSRRKIFILSTPVTKGASIIESEFLKTDQRYYYVPCPHCETFQTLKWENVNWPEGKPEEAEYHCEECGAAIAERFKTKMLAKGEWRSTKPENTNAKRVGYHLNALYSPLGWFSWADAASEFINAGQDDLKLKTFYNTVLGLPWEGKGEKPEWQNIYNRRETYATNTVNNEVCFITAGVDVQKDRIEVEIVGWGKGKKSWSIDYRVIEGSTEKPETWAKLNAVTFEQWTRKDGLVLPLRSMAIDSGYNTTHVYQYCMGKDPSRVFPIKGLDGQSIILSNPKQVSVSRTGKRVGNLRLWTVGVSIVKSELYSLLKLEKDANGNAPNGYCFFPQYSQEYFKGLTGEERRLKTIRGYARYEWHKIYERNEPLDCRVYARAAAAYVGIDRMTDEHFDAILAEYGGGHVQAKKDSKPKKQSSFW